MTEIFTNEYLQSGVAALVFAAVFLVGHRLNPSQKLLPSRRSMISFAAGSSSAYVFVYMMPELAEVRESFVESMEMTLRFEGMAIYFIALIGFMVFYGLENFRARFEDTASPGETGLDFKIHIGGFAAYVWLVSYIATLMAEETVSSILLYIIAMTFHFLATDHALHEEHGDNYQHKGRYGLAAMAVLGWVAGLAIPVSEAVLAIFTAFISGAVIMNSSLSELPTEKDGRLQPFIAGGILYGLVLIPL